MEERKLIFEKSKRGRKAYTLPSWDNDNKIDIDDVAEL